MEDFLRSVGGEKFIDMYATILRDCGVDTVDDIHYLDAHDFKTLGFKLVHWKKIMRAAEKLKKEYVLSRNIYIEIEPETSRFLLMLGCTPKREQKLKKEYVLSRNIYIDIEPETKADSLSCTPKREQQLLNIERNVAHLFSSERLSVLTAFARGNEDKGITFAALKLVLEQVSFLTQVQKENLISKQSAFFSHVQKYSSDLCRSLYLELGRVGVDIWYDMDADRLDARGMIQGIASSERFVIIATTEYFERPWPVFENIVAEILGKPILVLLEPDSRYGGLPFDLFCSKIPGPWKRLKDHEFMKIERRRTFWYASITEIKERLEMKINTASKRENIMEESKCDSKLEIFSDALDEAQPVGQLNETQFIDKQPFQPISWEGTQGNQSNWTNKCKARAKIINELVATEKSYIKKLEELQEFLKPFAKPLRKNVGVDVSSFERTVDALIDVHNGLQQQFCIEKNICVVFYQKPNFLKMYKYYVQDFDVTSRSLEKASTKKAFKSIFRESKYASQDPVMYFTMRAITIVQRVPRYSLKLRNLRKKTQVEHPMYNDVEKALEEVRDASNDITSYMLEQENKNKLIAISEEIDIKTLRENGIAQLIIPSRRIIRVEKISIKRVKKSRIFNMNFEQSSTFELSSMVMCNDILIVMHGKKNRVLRVFQVAGIEVNVNMHPVNFLEGELFQVKLRNRDEEFFSFYVRTLDEAQGWESSILKYSNA